jgi:SAM-dependent methyltransferase
MSDDTAKPARCRICGADSGHNHFLAREMYFGTQEQFDYFECGGCGTIQIRDSPADLARHYPADYYSFAGGSGKRASGLEIALRRQRSDAWLGGGNAFGGLLARLSKKRPVYFDWLADMHLTTDSRIVDVGCGGGELLLKMRRDGFRRLSGLDPFVTETIQHAGGVTVHKRGLAEDEGRYDLIMLHHSFEHMPDPVSTMAEIARHLTPAGRALLRLPIAGGHAWRTYRENWYALDAPRHLVIPTLRAMRLLAAGAGLEVERHFFDSDTGQFLASEAYQQGIPLIEQMRSPLPARGEEEMARLRTMAEELNRQDDGDSGGFVLRRRQAPGGA